MRRYVWWYATGAIILAMLVLWPLAAAGLLPWGRRRRRRRVVVRSEHEHS
ncbi:MAG: hypothetical protein ACRDPS_05915 [Nocardioides sp.]